MAGQQNFRESVAANTRVEIDLGRLRQLSAGDGRARVYATSPTDGALQATFLIGQRVIQSNGILRTSATAGRVQIPDDLFAEGLGLPGDQLTLEVENTTGGAIIFAGTLVVD
ncbi:MAG: hypothetical protein V3T33_09875 [Myxococcota bacterium]